MSKVRYTNKAVEDLSSIWLYTVEEWSETQADVYYNMLIDTCNRICSGSSLLGRRYDEVSNGLLGLHAGHHIIFYRMHVSGDVLIIRILHEKMDLKRHFSK